MNGSEIDKHEVENIIAEFLSGRNILLNAVEKVIHYYKLLESWNNRVNLISLHGWTKFLKEHILDSISILKCDLIKGNEYLCDIGSGGGLPVVPVKIFSPELNLVMTESISKKANALIDMVCELKLKSVEVLNERVEYLGAREEWRKKFDMATVRALGKTEEALEYAMPLLKIGGHCVLYKTETENIGTAALEVLGGDLVDMYDYKIEGLKKRRRLIVIRKRIETPKRFPRKVGIARKRPIVL